MSYYAGSLTFGTAGTAKQYVIGFQPTWARLTVSSKGSSDSVCHMSYGIVDNDGYQYSHSIYGDSTGFHSEFHQDKMLLQKERVGGVLTTVLDVSFNSYYSNGIKLDVNTESTYYTAVLECGN